MAPTNIYEVTALGADSEIAVKMLSMPQGQLRRQVSDPFELMSLLRLRPALEIPRQALDQAVSSIVLNDSIGAAAGWLRKPPDPVEVREPTKDELRVHRLARPVTEAYEQMVEPEGPIERKSEGAQQWTVSKKGEARRTERRLPAPKGSSVDAPAREFAAELPRVSSVPFQRSPINFYDLADLTAKEVRIWLTTVGTNPLLLLQVVGGYILMHAAVGIGGGLRRGLSDGLRYRILKMFGVPDEPLSEGKRLQEKSSE